MLEALSLNILLGLIWFTLGVTGSRVAATRTPIIPFFALGTTFGSVAAWALLVDWPVLLRGDIPRGGELVFWAALAGAVNGGAAILIVESMRRGHNGMSMALVQSAMVVPFLASVLIWREAVHWSGWIGVGCVLAAIAAMALQREQRNRETEASASWLPVVLLAFCILGAAQTLFSVSSRWEADGWRDVANLRPAVALTAACLTHVAFSLLTRRRPGRETLRFALVYVVLALLAFKGLFLTLDRMAGVGLAGLVFPIGVGTLVTAFTLYSALWLREPFTRLTRIALAFALGGVLLLALGKPAPEKPSADTAQAARK